MLIDKQADPRNFRLPQWLLLVFFVAYALPGNLLHAPWRGDDIATIAVAMGMLRGGSWLTPTLAGAPYLEWWPPLAHWLGASLGWLLGWLLPVYDAIRLASVVSLAIMVWCLRGASRLLYGEDSALAAVLITLGSLGLLVHAHEAQPMMLLGATVAATFYGLALMREKPRRGAVTAGIAAGAAFLCGGLAGVVLTLPLWFVMPLICTECHDKGAAREWALALLLAVVIGASWPLALSKADPVMLRLWWDHEWNAIVPHVYHLARFDQLLSLMAWFTWPLWLIALWSLWRQRRQIKEFRLLLPLCGVLAALWLISTTGSLRNANAMPLLPPLILLAAGELPKLRRGAINFLDWFGVMTFSLVILFLWVAFFAVQIGWPTGLARNIRLLAQGYTLPFSLAAVSLALLLTAGWIASIVRMPFFQMRGAVHWALGVTLMWGVAHLLWQPWFDFTKNYDEIMHSIAKDSADRRCLATLGAGPAQHAALDYFENIQPLAVSEKSSADTECDYLLVYASGRNHLLPQPTGEWTQQWSLRRGRGRTAETFVLMHRH